MTPTVSVIVPNYNHARFLRQRLESILNQTYQDFELIILDDCSTDNSRDIIMSYKNNSKVSHIVFNKTNSGSAFNQWNKGIGLSKGKYVWIAESDDFCELNMLEELLRALLHKKNTVLSYSTSMMVGEDGIVSARKHIQNNNYMSGRNFIRKCLIYSNVIRNASSVLFSREAALRASPNYLEFRGAGDYMFWVEIALQGNVSIVNKQLNYCRVHGTNVTLKTFANGTAPEEDMKVFEYIKENMHLSRFRKWLSMANHALMFRNVEYDSEEIRRKSYDIWAIEERNEKLDTFVLRFMKMVKNRFNIYL